MRIYPARTLNGHPARSFGANAVEENRPPRISRCDEARIGQTKPSPRGRDIHQATVGQGALVIKEKRHGPTRTPPMAMSTIGMQPRARPRFQIGGLIRG